MSIDYRHTTPEDVVGKVLRRAEVAKVSLNYASRSSHPPVTTLY